MNRSFVICLLVLISTSACADDQPVATATAPAEHTPGAARSPAALESLSTDLAEWGWYFDVRVDESGTYPVGSFDQQEAREFFSCTLMETPAGRVLVEGPTAKGAYSVCRLRFEGASLHVAKLDVDEFKPVLTRLAPPRADARFVGLVDRSFIGVVGDNLVAWDQDNKMVWKSHVRGLQYVAWSKSGALMLSLLHEAEDYVVPEMRTVDPRTGQTLESRSMSSVLVAALNAPLEERVPGILTKEPRTDQVLAYQGLRVQVSDTSAPYLKVEVFDADGARLWRTWENAGKSPGRIGATFAGDFLVLHTVKNAFRRRQGRPNPVVLQTVHDLRTGAVIAKFRSTLVGRNL